MDRMMRSGNRTVKVRKKKLLDQIQKNKEAHVKEFEKAKDAYREEALRQLRTQLEEVEGGALEVKLDLVSPVDSRDAYDAAIEMFKWEVKEEVKLTQEEFRQYVQDETDFAVNAKYANTFYSASL